jgi:hypothetical protein
MCCGVGNLEVKHSNHRNIYMSTLDAADIDVMKATKTCVAATRFQYDYLNDDINDDGNIDYTLTNKIPKGLRDAIAEGKKILLLFNPPYAEVGNSLGKQSKTNVAMTKTALMMKNHGYASRELFTQCLVRISKEIPTATIAMFSTLKYVNAPNFEKFRAYWSAKYLDGFVVHSKAFDGLKGNFPIGFMVWKTDHLRKQKLVIDRITAEVLNKEAQPVGEKSFYNVPNEQFLSDWLPRSKKNNRDVIPLINAVTAVKKVLHVRNTKWADGAIAHFFCNGNDFQNSGTMTALFSSAHSIGHAGGYYITKENLWQAAIVFSVRLLIPHTWQNHNDQFLQPTGELSDEFKNNCLIWMLFHGKNLTASANDLEWNGQKWSIVNHFIPFTEEEVNAPDRFESDFMVQTLKNKKQSSEAKAILKEGKKLWQAYFLHTDNHTMRDEYKLNRPDVGWYQIRNALKKRNESGDYAPVSFDAFEQAYKALTEKLRPMVYELGFLKN